MVFSTVIIRLDNTQAISKLAKFLIIPGLNHMKAVDYNIYYLVSNKYLTIKFKTENYYGHSGMSTIDTWCERSPSHGGAI